jgi:release factor glutamine methyltransferase
MITLEQALKDATRELNTHPKLRPAALADAVLLLRHTLGVSRAALIANPTRLISDDDHAEYQRLIARRVDFEPMQYILGTQEFYGHHLRVTPAVLIPRPETETLVEAVIARCKPGRTIRIADVGTGSGAIAIALAQALPQASITALDISNAALAVARHNVEYHGLSDAIRLAESDLLAAVGDGEAPFDIIASNPPYIADEDAATLHPQVLDHEPRQALFAGPTGLEVYERLIPQAGAHLKTGGLLALEIGYGQREQIAALLAGWMNVEFVFDLQHIPRVALAWSPG